MKKKILLFALSLCIASCAPEEEEEDKTTSEYTSLRLIPKQDSLFMSTAGETRQFSLEGTLLNTSEETMTNSGIMTDVQYTVRHTDTVFQSVNNAEAGWFSSNGAVATVSNGLVTARGSGYTNITARIANVSSRPMVVNVRIVVSPPGGPTPEAPGLSLDPPSFILTFEDHVTVSGTVQAQAVLRVSEPRSGFSNANVSYTSTGMFSLSVTGLQTGASVITARASHPTVATLYTERSKSVAYYVYGSTEADGIVGNWRGTTLGKEFDFRIEKTFLPNGIDIDRYTIAGTLDIQFEGIGLVQDINLYGIINHNGTIDASLTKSYQGFTISGKFGGFFQTTGTGSGDYGAQATKTGWPKISFSEKWTAVKVP